MGRTLTRRTLAHRVSGVQMPYAIARVSRSSVRRQRRLYPRPWRARGNRFLARLERVVTPLQRVPARAFLRSLHGTAGFSRRRSSLSLPLFSSRLTSLGSALASAAPLSRLHLCSALVSVFCSALVFASLFASSLFLVRRVRPQLFLDSETSSFELLKTDDNVPLIISLNN